MVYFYHALVIVGVQGKVRERRVLSRHKTTYCVEFLANLRYDVIEKELFKKIIRFLRSIGNIGLFLFSLKK